MADGIEESEPKLVSLVRGTKDLLGVGAYLLLLGLVFEGLALVVQKWASFPILLASDTQTLCAVLCLIVCLAGVIWFNRSLDLIKVHLLDGRNELITSGPFTYVRHPLYSTLVMTIPPLAVIWFSDLLFFVPWALILVTAHLLVRVEERGLIEAFGQEYERYRRYVPALLPYKGAGGKRYREQAASPLTLSVKLSSCCVASEAHGEKWSPVVNIREFPMDSRAANLLFRLMAPVMESRLRYQLSDPVTILEGAGIRPGQEVLEIGCGTGFFTTSAAGFIGARGHLYAIDPHPLAIEQVTRKIRDAGSANVTLIKADATVAGLVSGCIDLALLFGVIPSPIIPLDRLLAEIHRVLRAEGSLAVWTAFPWWAPRSLTRSGLFVWTGEKSGVHSFRKATSSQRSRRLRSEIMRSRQPA